jgi:lipopolysaccharide transport protein LptA
LLTACLLYGFSGSGLESDKDQDILYRADGRSTSRIENDMRIVTLEQNVRVTQGTLEIRGDSARFEIEIDTSIIQRVTVDGSPAGYRQQLDESGGLIEGQSESILYYVEDEPVVELLGSATLRRPNDVLTCVSIKYFTDSRFTETTGPCEGVSSRAASPAVQ